MKPEEAAKRGPVDQGRELESDDTGRQARDDASDAPLPHESDQLPESQHEEGTRDVGEQAHRDLEKGLVDTDRRGGEAYQQETQRDAHANANSGTRRE